MPNSADAINLGANLLKNLVKKLNPIFKELESDIRDPLKGLKSYISSGPLKGLEAPLKALDSKLKNLRGPLTRALLPLPKTAQAPQSPLAPPSPDTSETPQAPQSPLAPPSPTTSESPQAPQSPLAPPATSATPSPQFTTTTPQSPLAPPATSATPSPQFTTTTPQAPLAPPAPQTPLAPPSANLPFTDKDFDEALKSTDDLAKKLIDVTKQLEKNPELLEGFNDEIVNIQNQILENQELISKSIDSEINLTGDLLKTNKKLNDKLDERIKWQEKLNTLTEELEADYNNLANTKFTLDGIKNEIEKIPILGKMLTKLIPFDQLKEQFTNVFKTMATQFIAAKAAGVSTGRAIGMSFRAAIKPLMAFAASLWAALAPLLPIILPILAAMALFKAAWDMGKEVAEFSKELGVGIEKGAEMKKELSNIAATSSNLQANTENLTEAHKAFSDTFGLTDNFSQEMLEDQIQMTKSMGLTNQQAMKFQKMSMKSGKPIREMEKDIASTVMQINKQTGATLSVSKIMGEVADLSAETKLNFKFNVEAMARTVAKAKLLGATLEDISKIGDETLNIENDIHGVIKAQYATGLQFNNNKIREAKLFGNEEDMLNAQAETVKSINDQLAARGQEFKDMYPFQRKMLAEGLHMTEEQLNTMLSQEKLMKTLGVQKADQITKDKIMASNLSDQEKERELAKLEELSQSEKLNKATDKLGAIWDQIVLAALPLLDILGPIIDFFVGFITPIAETVSYLAGSFSEIGEIISEAFGGGGIGGVAEFLGEMVGYISIIVEGPLLFTINFITGVIKSVVNMLAGVWKILKGIFTLDFDLIKDGFWQLIEGVIQWFARIPIALYETLISIFPAIGEFFSSLVASIKNYFVDMLPGWAINLLPNSITGADETEVKTEESVNDGVVQNGKVISTHPDDFLIATKNPSELLNSMVPSFLKPMFSAITQTASPATPSIDYKELASALAAQPINVVLNNKIVGEINRSSRAINSYVNK